jgi:hypothetical protein
MTRIRGERWAALAGLAFVVLYVTAFTLGIEVGASDREILNYYANSGNRASEVVAFFLIAGAALAFVVSRQSCSWSQSRSRHCVTVCFPAGSVGRAFRWQRCCRSRLGSSASSSSSSGSSRSAPPSPSAAPLRLQRDPVDPEPGACQAFCVKQDC